MSRSKAESFFILSRRNENFSFFFFLLKIRNENFSKYRKKKISQKLDFEQQNLNLFRGETRVRLNKIVASCVPEVIVKSIPRGHDRKGGRFHERSSRAVVVPFHFDSILATSFSNSEWSRG